MIRKADAAVVVEIEAPETTSAEVGTITTDGLALARELEGAGVTPPANATIEQLQEILAEEQAAEESAAGVELELPSCFGVLYDAEAAECTGCTKAAECVVKATEEDQITAAIKDEDAAEAEAKVALDEEEKVAKAAAKAQKEAAKAAKDAERAAAKAAKDAEKAAAKAAREAAAGEGDAPKKKAKGNVLSQASFAKNEDGKLFLVENPEVFTAEGGKIEVTFAAGDKLIVRAPRSKYNGQEVEFLHYSVKYECVRTKAEGAKYTVDLGPEQVEKIA